MKILSYENMPRWYTLSMDEKNGGLHLLIDRKFAETIDIPSGAPIVQHYTDYLSLGGLFDRFSPIMGNEFGWNGSLKKVNEDENILDYFFAFPKMRIETHFTCFKCDGTGEREFFGGVCPYCEGDKKHFVWDWRAGTISAASLSIFFRLSDFYEGETFSKKPQLITLKTIIQDGNGGGSLDGMFSEKMGTFLRETTDEFVSSVSQAMICAHKNMDMLRSYNRHSFRHNLNGGRTHLSCPGNACNVVFEASDYDRQIGGNISCHNVDSVLQQITLLAGLAKLCDLHDEFALLK